MADKKKDSKKTTRADKAMAILQDAKNGITCEDLNKQLGDKDVSRTHAVVNYLKCKRGCNITKKGGKYYLDGVSEIGAPKSNVSLLTPEDRVDYIDMMKKSYFYQLSAEALIKATVMAHKLA